MEISEKIFSPGLMQIPFYKGEIMLSITAQAATIDSAVNYFLSQSTKEDLQSLPNMYAQDLRYLDRYFVDKKTHILLALLAARSLINLYMTDLQRRLRCVIRPTDEERKILNSSTSHLRPVTCEDLIARRKATIKTLLTAEFSKLQKLIKDLYLQYKNFKLNIDDDTNLSSSNQSVLDLVPPGVFKVKERMYDNIFRKPGKAKSDVPFVYVLATKYSKRPHEEPQGAAELTKRQRSPEKI